MNTVAEILKITIPALLVLLTAIILLRGMIKNDQEKRKHELILQNNRTVIPIRLQALSLIHISEPTRPY